MRVQFEFSRNPQQFVAFLMSRHSLKGNVRDALTDFILAHQDLPGIGEMFCFTKAAQCCDCRRCMQSYVPHVWGKQGKDSLP